MRKLRKEDLSNFDTKGLTGQELQWYNRILNTIPKEEKEMEVNITKMTQREANNAAFHAFMDWHTSDLAQQFPKGWSEPDEALKLRYKSAIRAAKVLEKKGFIEIKKIYDPEIPYQYHAFEIKWIPSKENDLGTEAKDSKYLLSMLKDMDLEFESGERADEWQIGREIYILKPEYEGKPLNPTVYAD